VSKQSHSGGSKLNRGGETGSAGGVNGSGVVESVCVWTVWEQQLSPCEM